MMKEPVQVCNIYHEMVEFGILNISHKLFFPEIHKASIWSSDNTTTEPGVASPVSRSPFFHVLKLSFGVINN
jgi:hypothetical protein